MNPARVSYIREKVALDTSGEDPWTFEARHTDGAREKARGAGQWLKGKRCLDVGCGGGLLSETLARLGGDVVGVDASKENIGIARTHAGQDPFLPLIKDTDGEDGEIRSSTRTRVEGRVGSLEYRHTSAELLRDAGEKFDVVCAMEVLEHVDEPGEFMKCLGEMVKVSPA
jgi:2-polyprenyl-6-hydroxyphenyl methylase/3-demethylubiquinone-9 3-methyltransferase